MHAQMLFDDATQFRTHCDCEFFIFDTIPIEERLVKVVVQLPNECGNHLVDLPSGGTIDLGVLHVLTITRFGFKVNQL